MQSFDNNFGSQAFANSYGSNENGLIWGYHFLPEQEVQPINAQDALALLRSDHNFPKGEFLWLHFSLSNSSSIPWLKEQLQLPEAFFENLLSGLGSTRLEQESNSLTAVLHDVLFDLTFDYTSVATSTLHIDSRLFVSARLRPLRSIEQLRADVRNGIAFRSPAELLAQLLGNQAGVLLNISRDSTARVDKIEDKLITNRISFSRRELGTLRRDLVRLQRLLSPEPPTFFRLLNRPPKWISTDELQELREAAEELSAAVNDTEALVERVRLIQEEVAALVNEQTNRTLYVLTMVTVLALPINLVAGIFGMNVTGIPFSEHPHGFAFIVVTLISISGLLAYLALLKRRD